MKDKNVKIYDNTGKLVVDLEAGLFEAHHLSYEDWSKLFGTNFQDLKFYDKSGNLIGGYTKGEK